jgi:hypothetical protein
VRSLRTRLVAFDTAVADLTDLLHDPVDVLFGVQLGGGTDLDGEAPGIVGLEIIGAIDHHAALADARLQPRDL